MANRCTHKEGLTVLLVMFNSLHHKSVDLPLTSEDAVKSWKQLIFPELDSLDLVPGSQVAIGAQVFCTSCQAKQEKPFYEQALNITRLPDVSEVHELSKALALRLVVMLVSSLTQTTELGDLLSAVDRANISRLN